MTNVQRKDPARSRAYRSTPLETKAGRPASHGASDGFAHAALRAEAFDGPASARDQLRRGFMELIIKNADARRLP